MATNVNADAYANARIGIFFPGNPRTLDGQCVSLVKWFLQEMTSVPAPQAARGHAMDYGNNLVAQGHAVEVGASQRLPGDIVVWQRDGGGYGHIGILLTGDRIFEQNVNVGGSATMRVPQGDGTYATVYASRIDGLYDNWRIGSPRFYRVNTYVGNVKKEEDMIPDTDNYYFRYGQKTASQIRGRQLSRAEFRQHIVGRTGTNALEILSDDPEADKVQRWQEVGKLAVTDNWQQQIYDLQKQLTGTVSKADLEAARATINDMTAKLASAEATAAAALAEKQALNEKIAKADEEEARRVRAEQETDNAITNVLRSLWKRITGEK